MKKITVGLYGTMDSKNACRAEEVYCDKCDVCQFFKEGSCLNVTAPFSHRCKYGRINRIKGYSKRAKKYNSFISQYKHDEMYGKLHYPSNWTAKQIGDELVLNLRFVDVQKRHWNGWEWEDTEDYIVDTANMFWNKLSYISKDEFTKELLDKICKYRPRAIIGGTIISEYQDKVIPELMYELGRIFPSEYEVSYIKPNRIGSFARASTLIDGSSVDTSNGTFVKDGEYLICEQYKSSLLSFKCEYAYVKLKINEETRCKITNNECWDENTIFL